MAPEPFLQGRRASMRISIEGYAEQVHARVAELVDALS